MSLVWVYPFLHRADCIRESGSLVDSGRKSGETGTTESPVKLPITVGLTQKNEYPLLCKPVTQDDEKESVSKKKQKKPRIANMRVG